MIITINRQYGSGGREIGQKLSEKLGIGFYDKELISIAAKDSGFAEALFENADEKPSNSLLYSIVSGSYNPRAWFFGGTDILTNDTLFNIQAEVIRKVSAKPCVIVGRCADFILREREDLFTVFTRASQASRIKFVADANPKYSQKECENYIKKMDKSRTNYYSYYTNREWSDALNYDLCINTDKVSIDQSVELIIKALEMAGLK